MRISLVSTVLFVAATEAAGRANVQRRQNGPVDPSTIKDCTFYTDYPSTDFPGQGNTCASIAEYWGISEQQFITYNPSVGSDCSKLVQGNSYCVEENNGNGPISPTVTTVTPTPTPTGAPTPTQSGLTKDCTRFYLVKSGDYCQAIVDQYGTFTLDQFYSWNPAIGTSCGGLQAGYYVCVGTASTPTGPITSPSPTPTGTGPQPQQPGITTDCKSYYKIQSGDGCQSIVDKYGTFSLDQFYSWNPSVGNDCSKLFGGYYVCVGVSSTPTQPPTTTASPTPTGPSPTQTGIRQDCRQFYQAVSGDSCDVIVNKFRTFTVADFESWNPAVGSDCSKLFLGYYYCVAVPGTPTTPIQTPIPTPTGRGPQPQQPGIVSNCSRYYKVAPGDYCDKIEQDAGINPFQFFGWNTGLKTDCSNLFAGYYVCTGAP